MAQLELTRRTFAVGGLSLLVGAAIGVGVNTQVATADVLRPPGSLDEADFMARCIKCERCISVCPENILVPMGIEEGVLQVRTPRIDYSAAACTFCDECRKVCPTAAIGSVDPLDPGAGRIGVAIVHEDRCLAFHNDASCGICVDACPYRALSFGQGRQPVVDDNLCNGCGECVAICPANVATSFSGGSERGIEVITERSFSRLGATQ